MSSSIIKIDPNRGKLIKFELDINGVDRQLLHAKFVVTIHDIDYGFPATINNHMVEVKIPCLFDVICSIETFKGFVQARLMIFSEDLHFVPWEGQMKILPPKKITAKIKSVKQQKPKIRTEDVDFDEQEEIIVDDPQEEVSIPEPTDKQKKADVPVVEKKKVTNQPQNESISLNEDTRSEYLEKLKNIDEKGIRSYMARAGTKSAHIQDIILEQADGVCPDSEDKFELLKAVVKVMNDIKKGAGKDGMSMQ
jgi:hypothetical protein